MINFTGVQAITIPEGTVRKITNVSGLVLWEKVSGNEYTFVDSIYLADNVTLNTDIGTKSADYVYLDCTPMTSNSYRDFVNAGSSTKMRFWADGTGIYANISWYNTKIANLVSGIRTKLAMVAQKILLDGVQKVDMSAVPQFVADTNLILGGVPMLVHGFQHGKSSDVLDMDYIPAIRKSDDVAGLYDNISGTFVEIGAAT